MKKRILHGVLTLVFALGLMMIPGLLPETVCTASAEDAAVGHAGQEGWTEWTDTTSLPTGAGKYYLTEDVTLNVSWYIPEGETTLCLNGKTIRTREGKSFPLIQTHPYRKLTVCDHSSAKSGSIGGGRSLGGGVRVKSGTITLESGSINGNRVSRGGGVYIDGGTFNMKGGSISGNTTVHTGASGGEGGGVYIDGGTFNMEGGSISGNTADLGGGVYINGGTFNIGSAENEESKDINISGNRSNGKTSNVTLSSGRTITVTGHVGEASKIGVTTDTKPQDSNPVVFTAGLNGKGSISNFLSDEGYAVTRTEGDSPEAQLTDHKHQWTINEAASGNGYEIKCDAANCHYGVYTATAEDQDYTGKPYGGAVIDAESALPPELSISPWTYTGRGDTTYGPSETTPTNAGIYTASAEMKTWADPDKIETISLPFSINRASLTIKAKDQTYEYDGQPHGEGDAAYDDPAAIAEKIEADGLQNGDEITSITLDGAETEIGEYKDRIQITGFMINDSAEAKDNYNITLVPGTLTITKLGTDMVAPEPMTAKGKNALTIHWRKVSDAQGYDIFFSICGKDTKCKLVKTIKGNDTFSWTKTGLKTKTPYKAYVKGWIMQGGKKKYISKSPMLHMYTANGTNNYTVAKSIKVKKTKVTLKAGKVYKIKAKIIKRDKTKKLMPATHTKQLRYISTNKKVAAVSKSGKIKAKGKGSCKIYVYATNGVNKAIKVTVR